MRILIRTSKWALWARRLGTFAVPLAILPVFMHRAQLISSETFFLILVLAAAIAAAGFVAAVGAAIRLWFTGDRGWGKAATGFVFSLFVLVPAAVGAYAVVHYPPVNDVSTDLARPPPLTTETRRIKLTGDLIPEVAAAFPNAASRTYPVVPQQVFKMAEALVAARGWEVVARTEPMTALSRGQINAISMDLIGWRDEISIRIEGVPEGATVAMRSASLASGHDLGVNGTRIEEFLLALDGEITTLMRNAALAEPDAELAPADEVPQPIPDGG